MPPDVPDFPPMPGTPAGLLDADRLDALRGTALLDAPPEVAFDRFTSLVRRLFGVPVALVSFVDADRQVFVSQDGLPEPWATRRQTPLSHSFCQHVVLRDAPLVVTDARRDPVLCDNLAVQDINVVGYLGVPVHGPGGHALGSLCALTSEPRAWTTDDVSVMENLAALVETELALRDSLRVTTEAHAQGRDREDALVVAAAARQAAQRALQASETHLREVLDSLFAFVAVLTPDGALLDINRSVFEATGLRPADVAGVPFWDAAWWSYDDAVRAQVREACLAAQRGEAPRFEARARIADGRLLPVDVTIRALRDASGRVTHLIPSAVDISDRVEAEAALRASEARFRRMADAAPALLWVTDADGACTFLSQRWYDTTGQTHAEGLGLGWLDAVHPDDRATAGSVFQAASERGEPFQFDYRLRQRDGTYRWALDVGRPHADDSGAFVGYVGSVIDIHDRTQAEARSRLLAETGRLAERALDYEDTLARIAGLAVPGFADWCGVDVVQPDGEVRSVAIAHADPAKVRWAQALRERYPTAPDAETGVARVLRTGRPELYTSVSDDALAAVARDAEHLRLMRELGLRSAVIVPMRAGSTVTGALTFVLAGTRPGYERADIETAEEIARRAGAALETARLHTALREREARYRSLFESVDVGFCILDILYDEAGTAVDYRFLETNPAFVRQSGLRDAEGQTIRALVPDTDPGRIATYAAVAESGVATRLMRENSVNGRWFDIYAVRVGGLENRHVAVFSTDITESRATQQALHESEERYRTLFESLDVGVCLLEVLYDEHGAAHDYRFLDVNPAFVSQTGLDGARGRTVREMVPSIEQRWIDVYAGVVATGEPVRLLDEVAEMGRWFDVYGVRVGPREAHRVSVFFTDVSHQRAAEQALRDSEAHFRQLAEALPTIVYTSDACGVTDYLNGRWYDYTGQPADTPVAEAGWGAIHPDDLQTVTDAWTVALTRGQSFEADLRLRRHDGAFRWFRTQVVPVTDAEGRVVRWFGSSTDIQTNKDVEAELSERVAERTAELARSNAELDQFAYVASHDLKAPIRAIDSLAAWIEDDAGGVLPPESARHLALLRGRAARMERLLDSLLAYSRAGRGDARAEPLDVSALVADAVALVAPPEGVTVRVDGPLPSVAAARSPLALVFRNLIGNAIKHHDRADGEVVVSGHADGAVATFTVADNGPGIAPEYHQRVFGLFQTLRPRDEVEGSGMGLAIVQKTVESQGGRVWLEPGDGRGATFRFTWPLSPATPSP